MLDLRFTMAAADWSALKADTTNDIYFPAELRCGDDPPLPHPVGIRRKRSGGIEKPGCKTVGEPCTGDTDCCSFTCRDNGSGFQSCQYLGGCRPAGELCGDDGDCCNDAVDPQPGTCDKAISGSPVGRCQNPGGCAPAGEVCGTASGPSGSNECCPGSERGASEAACQPTTVGTRRCFVTGTCLPDGVACDAPSECCSGICEGGICGATPCIQDGRSCAFSDQCCSGICAPSPTTGELVCNPGCVPDGQACTANADCCGGTCNTQTLTCGYIVVIE